MGSTVYKNPVGNVDGNTPGMYQGLDANKPANGGPTGTLYLATDTNKLYSWNGAAWVVVLSSGGGGGSLFIGQTITGGSGSRVLWGAVHRSAEVLAEMNWTTDGTTLDMVGSGNLINANDLLGTNVTGTNTFSGHMYGNGSTPGIVVGSIAGPGAVASIIGTDFNGNISVSTSALGGGTGVLATITFNVPYSGAPRSIVLTPANLLAATVPNAGFHVPIAAVSATQFTLNAAALPAAGAVYEWSYIVIA